MSCDRTRARFFARVAAAAGAPAAATELETLSARRRRAPAPDAEALVHAARTRARFALMRQAGLAPPTRRRDGLPAPPARAAYAAVYDELRRRGWLPDAPAAPALPPVETETPTALSQLIAHANGADIVVDDVLHSFHADYQQRGCAPPLPLQWWVHAASSFRPQLARMASAAVLGAAGVARCRACGRFIAPGSHTCAPGEDARPSWVASLTPLLDQIRQVGGIPLVVGGAVREHLMGADPKDVDLEVYGLPVNRLEEILRGFGEVNAVGRSFGVLKLQMPGDRVEIDVSIPRRESKTGRGHTGFLAEPDPAMTPWEAAARRDFTFNAMAYDPETRTVLDFYGGWKDLQDRIIRHTSSAFGDDPLRVLRAMQFAARLRMRLAPETAQVCADLRAEADALPLERVWGEWEKFLTRGVDFQAGLQALDDSGWLALYPELDVLRTVEHDAFYHPEGDALRHTKLVAGWASLVAQRERLSPRERIVLGLAAIVHDVGKATTTTGFWQRAGPSPGGAPPGDGPPWQPDPDVPGGWRRWRVTSHGHEHAGVSLAETCLRRMGAPADIRDEVTALVRTHLAHVPMLRLMREIEEREAAGQDASQQRRAVVRMLTRLAVTVQPSSLRMLFRLIECDLSGCPPRPPQNPCAPLLAMAEDARIAEAPPTPILMGRHLIAARLAAPGKAMGEVLRAAFAAQLDGVFSDLNGALAWARAFLEESPRSTIGDAAE